MTHFGFNKIRRMDDNPNDWFYLGFGCLGLPQINEKIGINKTNLICLFFIFKIDVERY